MSDGWLVSFTLDAPRPNVFRSNGFRPKVKEPIVNAQDKLACSVKTHSNLWPIL